MSGEWVNFSSELQGALLALLEADAELGTSGTYSVVTREEMPAVASGYELSVPPSSQPYIGVAAISGPQAQLGHLELPTVRFIVVCLYPATTSEEDARLQAVGMAHRVQKLIRAWHGAAPGATGHVVLVEDVDCSDPVTDEDDGSAGIVVTATVPACFFEAE